MKSLRLYGPRDFRVVDEPPPVPGPTEALLAVRSVTICHSDIHWYKHGRIGDTMSEVPLVVGHEFAAEVIEVGPKVQRVQPGDLVAVEPAISCGHCDWCREGNPNLCDHLLFSGSPPLDGAMREYLTYGEEFLFPLPEGMVADQGALLEPLGVAIHAWDLGQLRVGQTVAIVGCGPIGLLLVDLARIAGASQVFAVEPLDYRRDVTEGMGAVPLPPDVDLETHVLDLTGGRGVDLVVEVAGTLSAQEESVRIIKRGGTAVFVGIPPEDQLLLTHHVIRRKGLTIKLCRRMKLTYPRAITLVQRKMIALDYLITHRYPLERADEAFRLVEDYEDGVIKAALYPDS